MAQTNAEPAGDTATATIRKCGCGEPMRELQVGTRLSVHLPGDTPEAYWTATPLDAWTCVACGKTDLYARNPRIFRAG